MWKMLKIRLAVICGLLLLWGAACPVLAEDPTDPDTQPVATETDPAETVPSGEETGTDRQTDPTGTGPSDPDEATSASGTEPTVPAAGLATSIAIRVEGEELILTVTDEEGDPVAGAPLTLYLDKEALHLTGDEEGTARHTLLERPARITCSMAAFGVYESAYASLELQPEETDSVGTDPEPTGTARVTRAPTTLGPVVTWTNPEAEGGEATGTETTLSQSVTATETAAPTVAAEVNKYPRNLARNLIILGGFLLAAAAVSTFVFLAYAPRQAKQPPQEQQEPEESAPEEE